MVCERGLCQGSRLLAALWEFNGVGSGLLSIQLLLVQSLYSFLFFCQKEIIQFFQFLFVLVDE